jgi:hypothetical protein
MNSDGFISSRRMLTSSCAADAIAALAADSIEALTEADAGDRAG